MRLLPGFDGFSLLRTRAAHSQQGQPNGTLTAAPAATNSPAAVHPSQPSSSQGKRAFHYLSLYDKLDLTRDQQEKLSVVFQEAYSQSKAVNEDKSLPMPQKLEAMIASSKTHGHMPAAPVGGAVNTSPAGMPPHPVAAQH